MIKTGCRFYKGYKPCLYHLKKGVSCTNCTYYEKIDKKIVTERKKILKRLFNSGMANPKKKSMALKKKIFEILIIKLGAPGDVLRTTPILKTLKKKYPFSRITWVSKKQSLELLEENPYIDKLVEADLRGAKSVLKKKYDLLLSFDKETFATALATAAKSGKKLGFKMDRFGALNIFNGKSAYALRLGIDNKLKFSKNTKTYQAIIYEMSELKTRYGPYLLSLDEKYTKFGARVLRGLGIRPHDVVIGLNTGAGKVFLTKKWPVGYFIKLSRMLNGVKGVKTILLGGPPESRINRLISKKTYGNAINAGTRYSKKEFAGLIDNCDIIITSDTLCMHLAVARENRIVALFGPTAEKEVDLYGLGKKIYPRLRCSPCYKSRCRDTKCMKSILPETVFKEIKKNVRRTLQKKTEDIPRRYST